MNKKPAKLLSTAAVFGLTAIILLFPEKSLYFACNGLNLWFENMIPTLFPFMVLSGIMIRMNLTDSFVKLLKPVLQPIFQVNSDCLYAIIIGFLCGFPMGANVSAQLYERDKITYKEAEFLLSFCNNIGPVYFISFALPAIGITHNILPFIFGMYGLPFLYGILLRYTLYRNIPKPQNELKRNAQPADSFLPALDESVMASLGSITKLGGYMIFFNLLNILPFLFIKNQSLNAAISGILEITGGIKALSVNMPFLTLCLLPFGGFSCIAQTYSMIKGTCLSLKKYVIHKLILTALSVLYYCLLAGISF